MRCLLLALLAVVTACHRPPAVAPTPTPVVTTPAEGPVVRDPVARLDVHGGDGDGSIAMWSLVVSFHVDNPGPNPMVVHAVRWEAITLGITSERPTARVLEPGDVLVLDTDAYIALDDLDAVRAAETLDMRLLVRWSNGGQPETDREIRLQVPVEGW
jgi:hypothetical protein